MAFICMHIVGRRDILSSAGRGRLGQKGRGGQRGTYCVIPLFLHCIDCLHLTFQSVPRCLATSAASHASISLITHSAEPSTEQADTAILQARTVKAHHGEAPSFEKLRPRDPITPPTACSSRP